MQFSFSHLLNKYTAAVFLGLVLTACTTPLRPSFRGELKERAYSIELKDASYLDDGHIVLTGRFDDGEYKDRQPDQNPSEYIQKSFHGSPMTIVHKINAKGDSIWTKLFPYSLEGSAITQDAKGNLIIVGYRPTEREKAYKGDRSQAVTLLKIDAKGEVLWFKLIPSDYNSVGQDVEVLPNGDILVLADRSYPRYSDFEMNPNAIRLIRLKSDGTIIWDKTLSKLKSRGSYSPEQLLKTKAGGLFIMATEFDKRQTLIAEIDAEAEIKQMEHFYWSKGYSEEYNFAFSMVEHQKGLLFSCSAFHGESSQHLVKLNSDLQKVWGKGVNGCNSTDRSYLGVDAKSNIYFTAPLKRSGYMLRKYNSKGEQEWDKRLDSERFYEIGTLLSLNKEALLFVANSHRSGKSDWQGEYFVVEEEQMQD